MYVPSRARFAMKPAVYTTPAVPSAEVGASAASDFREQSGQRAPSVSAAMLPRRAPPHAFSAEQTLGPGFAAAMSDAAASPMMML